jgi:hypothetical protein
MKKLLLIIATVFFIQVCNAQADSLYFGQTPPGNTPVLFAPNFISLNNRAEYFITFSIDGKECYFTIDDANGISRIMETVYRDSAWTIPKEASFAKSRAICPSISPDGTKLFFSYPVVMGVDDRGIYQCQRTDSGWSAPVEMDRKISSRVFESSCRLSDKGNFYICSWRSGGKGGCDGWRIPFVNGQYQQAENLGFLNSSDGDCHWAPGPDENYLIWNSRRPLTGNGSAFYETDLFITFALPNGRWTYPRNLGPKINSSATDMGAWISHDGKYLFFASDRRGTERDNDIYWVSTNYIDSLRKTNFPPYVNRTIPSQKAKQDILFTYQIPDSTFIDDDGNNTLRYTAILNNGYPLPAWLLFDSITCVFSGTPDTVAIFNVKVTAIDTAGTSASCTFRITVVSSSSSGIKENRQLPIESMLYQNYPNPFDRSTTIYFVLKEPGNCVLTIYNLAGQKMETVLSEYKNAGEYQFVWKGTNYSKGKYLCHLQVSEARSGKISFEDTIQILLR